MYTISGYPKEPTGCTLEALACPDGSAVGRVGPKCEFAPCPTINLKKMITPSATPNGNYLCPKTEWIDCMPGPDRTKTECNAQYLEWSKKNCPNFKGAAY